MPVVGCSSFRWQRCWQISRNVVEDCGNSIVCESWTFTRYHSLDTVHDDLVFRHYESLLEMSLTNYSPFRNVQIRPRNASQRLLTSWLVCRKTKYWYILRGVVVVGSTTRSTALIWHCCNTNNIMLSVMLQNTSQLMGKVMSHQKQYLLEG